MMQHRNRGGTGLENGKQVVKRTGVVGYKYLTTSQFSCENPVNFQ